MNKVLLISAILFSFAAKAQKLDSIYVKLYTDSLKKGTYNYINIDGLFSNGRYLPLDTNHLVFSADEGKFYGNSLWLDSDCKKEKVNIKVCRKDNKNISKEFTVYIKKKPDDEKLQTTEELLKDMESKSKKKK